jgi:hypothetical protein
MPIKNKDGTVYKLKEPNPLVKEQEWGLLDSELIFHNFDWTDKTISADSNPNPLSSDFEVKDKVVSDFPEIKAEPKETEVMTGDDFLKGVEEATTEAEIDDVENVVLKDPEPIKAPESNPSNAKLKNVVIMHCSPAEIREREDDLYGDIYKTIQYGEKFTFESVILERNDLYIRFWTNVDLSEGSVVYPSKYRSGVKYGEHRWWRVNQSTEKSGGYLIQAVVSDYHPDFS